MEQKTSKQTKECYEITTAPEDFSAVREALEKEGLEFLEAEVQMIPSTYITLDEKGAEKNAKTIRQPRRFR